MIIHLHNKLYTVKSIFYIAILCVVFMPIIGMAQLIVKDNTKFFLKGKLSTATQTNKFYSDIKGEQGVLFFVGKAQTIQTAAQASLSNVVVNNASELSVFSKLQIKGDLTISKGVLVLNHELLIHGKLELQSGAFIQNKHLITFVNEAKQYNKSTETITYNQNSIPALFSNTEHETAVYNLALEENKSSFTFNFYKSHTLSPVKPPPLFLVQYFVV